MKNIFFSSDLHFGHENIIKFCNRPCSSVEEMDELIIQNWNKVVQKESTVYLLGDIFHGVHKMSFDEKQNYMIDKISRLNGEIQLVLGNHDKVMTKEALGLFETVQDYLEIGFSKKKLTVMSHFPFYSWNRARHGSWHLHGHTHGTANYDHSKKILDVGIDTHPDFRPYSFEEVREIMSKKKSVEK